MKRNIIIVTSLILIILVFSLLVRITKNEKSELETVRLAEVTHSIFYAPLYVSIENGYFKEEGIDIDLILTSGADKVSAAVLSNTVEIGFAGPESAIYVYENGEKDYLVTFAGLTKRDGQFIVAREKIDNFSVSDLYGKEVLAGRVGGMPILNFLNGIKNTNGDVNKIEVNSSIDFASLSGSFISGVGDYVNLFEPNALKIEKEGLGYVVGSIGELSGEMPYTAFYARKSYIEQNKETIKKFNKAINKGLEFVKNHTDREVAEVILKQFPDISLNDVEIIVKRYRDADSWLDNTSISEDTYKNLENIMIDNKLIEDYVPFNDLVIDLNE
ncbi:MAG: ABC transporter substrate-binding protein [Bacilli bacterium]|nr:ABC transporter substrate-binding protein [Bacilli bacterium]